MGTGSNSEGSQGLNSTVVDFEAIVALIRRIIDGVKSSKLKVLAWSLSFGAIASIGGFVFSPQYEAKLLLAVEEEESTGWQNLLASFGLDAGGLNPGGIFEGESLNLLFKTRFMLERTLLTKAAVNGDSVLLVNYLYPYTKWGKSNQYGDVVFPEHRSDFDPVHDSLLFEVQKYVAKSILDVHRPDKKLSLVNIVTTHEDKYFAKAFTEVLVDNTMDYYLETITRKARLNMEVLKIQKDSIQEAMVRALDRNAYERDNLVNPMFQRGQGAQFESFVDLQIANALYIEITKNLTLAEIGVRRQTPLIQIVDRPIFPLPKSGLTLIQWIGFGCLAGFFYAIYTYGFVPAIRKNA